MHYRDDDKVGTAPIRLFHGIADDYVSIAPCRDYVDRLQRAGADAILTGYPDAYHAYDITTLSQPIAMTGAQTTRNCILKEGDSGSVLNAKTGAVSAYTPARPVHRVRAACRLQPGGLRGDRQGGARIPDGEV